VLAWVGLPENNERKTVKVAATAGATTDYLESGGVTWADEARGRGPTGTAIRTGQICRCDDTESDPAFAPWRQRASQCGFRSSNVFPLNDGQRTFGAISIYGANTGPWPTDEVALLKQLADNLAFGMTALRTRKEREKAEDRLRYLAGIVEDTEDAVIGKDLDGTVRSWNRGAERMYGYTAEEMVGQNAARLEVPEHCGEVASFLKRIEKGESIEHHETERLRKDGSRCAVSITISAIRDTQGRITGVSAIARDITDRKRAEEELKLSQQRLALALKAAKSGTFDWEVATGKNVWSNEMEELHGMGPGAFGGTYGDWEKLVLPEDLPAAHNAIELALTTGQFTAEWRIRRRVDGQIRWVAARAEVFFDEQHKPTRMIGINIDIQDRKQAEEALKRYAAELERSNGELQDFASIASHDLQEPLRKVLAFGEHLRDHCEGKLDELGLDFLSRMQNAARRMSVLIEALLAYSRVATKAQPMQPVDMMSTVFGVLVDLEDRVAKTHARIEFGPLPKVMADPTQLRQVIQNLIGNALKFHKPDAIPHINIEGRYIDEQWCELTVRDNGIGFDEKYLDRIFRPFQRLHGRNEYEGSGMGLAICRKVVARHGGDITAHSQPGEGSTFVVTLPTVANASQETQERTETWTTQKMAS